MYPGGFMIQYFLLKYFRFYSTFSSKLVSALFKRIKMRYNLTYSDLNKNILLTSTTLNQKI